MRLRAWRAKWGLQMVVGGSEMIVINELAAAEEDVLLTGCIHVASCRRAHCGLLVLGHVALTR